MNKKIKITTLALALSLSFTACSNKEDKDNSSESSDTKSVVTSSTSNGESKESNQSVNSSVSNEDESAVIPFSDEDIVLRRSLSAPHGEDSFARVGVVTQKDKILLASIDEFQYFDSDDFKALPNQEDKEEFKAGAEEGKFLGSKVENDDPYSKLMTEKAKSKISIADNYKAIEEFVKGKTISDIEDIIADAKDGEAIDAISSATLVDTKGYLESIVDTAKNEDFAVKADTQDVENLDLKVGFGGRGDKNCLTDVFVLKQKDKIVATSIDEYQYFGENGVPNSDKKFGENYADSKNKLASKIENDKDYSDLMKEKGKSTKKISENFKAIQEFTKGKTADEIKKVADENEKGKPVDAVTGATLVDTVSYLDIIYDVAK